MNFDVIDFHCDALSKLQMDSNLDFVRDAKLDVNLERMRRGRVKLQCFAIYVSERLGKPSFAHLSEQIDIFKNKVIGSGIVPVTSADELITVEQAGLIGGILSIEGADGLEGNLHHLKHCYDRGVRLLGLTWNYANWAGDGILERFDKGLTPAGKELVSYCHKLGIILDVSHLSIKGFWQLAEMAEAAKIPFIASHSNAYQICSHVRNLRDDQISAMIALGGRIGVTFVPWFVKNSSVVSASDILPHIEHICSLGGEKTMMFGSDFDGIDRHIKDLKHSGHYENLVNLLIKHYPEELVRGWLSGNASGFLKEWLPQDK